MASESEYFVKELPAIEKHLANNIYEGFMLGGVKHGQGRYTWADGHVTIGNWIHGVCSAFTAERERRNPIQFPGAVPAKATRSKKLSVTQAKAKKKPMKDCCVACKTQCTFSFQCLNCTTGYCDSCDERFEAQGFKKKRPPCKCMIHQDGKAVAIAMVPVN